MRFPGDRKAEAVLTGAEAVAHAVSLVEPAVVPAYPITPQTHIIEKIAELVESGGLKAEFICVQSELGAIGAAAGAVVEGKRAFTATSSQGLLFMHEALHWVSGGRLPLVIAVCTRGVGAPWTLWCDLQDVMSQRDTGWMQIYASNAQEAMDFLVLAYKVAESVSIPAMVALDGFLISHTAEPVSLLKKEDVSNFLPEFSFELSLRPEDPFTLWAIPDPDKYYAIRHDFFRDFIGSLEIWEREFDAWFDLTGRRYSAVEFWDAGGDEAFVAVGAAAETVKAAIKDLKGLSLISLKLLRPFPEKQLREIITSHGIKRIFVVERALSHGRTGILGQEVLASVRDLAEVRVLVASLGGKDFSPEDLVQLYLKAKKEKEELIWNL